VAVAVVVTARRSGRKELVGWGRTEHANRGGRELIVRGRESEKSVILLADLSE